MTLENKLEQLIDQAVSDQNNKEHELELFNYILKFAYRVVADVFSDFKGLPMSVEDTYSYVYYILIDTIRWCQIHPCTSEHFVNLFLYKLRRCILNLCIKFSRNKHFVLNASKELEPNVEQTYETNVLQRNLLWEDVACLITLTQKRVLILRLKGYNLNEIASKLHVKKHFVTKQLKLIAANSEIQKLFNR